MTWLEKFYADNPYRLGAGPHSIGCPTDYVHRADCPKNPDGSTMSCGECWGREMPEIPEEKEKENKPMKKTKAMLEEELEQKRAEIEDLKKELETEIKKTEKYKQFEECADDLKALQTSFINSGFSEKQAFTMVLQIIGASRPRI